MECKHLPLSSVDKKQAQMTCITQNEPSFSLHSPTHTLCMLQALFTHCTCTLLVQACTQSSRHNTWILDPQTQSCSTMTHAHSAEARMHRLPHLQARCTVRVTAKHCAVRQVLMYTPIPYYCTTHHKGDCQIAPYMRHAARLVTEGPKPYDCAGTYKFASRHTHGSHRTARLTVC